MSAHVTLMQQACSVHAPGCVRSLASCSTSRRTQLHGHFPAAALRRQLNQCSSTASNIFGAVHEGPRCQRPLNRASKEAVEEVEEGEVEVVVENGAAASSGGGEGSLPAMLAEARRALDTGTIDEDFLKMLLETVETQLIVVDGQKTAAEARAADGEASAKASQTTLAALNTQLLRLTADFDNFRKRSANEKEAIKDKAKGDVIRGLIPLIDSFDSAKASLKPETDAEKKIDAAYQGLYNQMVQAFKGFGVEPVPGVGDPFNPAFHEAIMREPNDDVPDGTVLQEFRRGFRLGEMLLRPSMVKVSHSDAPTPPPPAEPASAADEAPADDVEAMEEAA